MKLTQTNAPNERTEEERGKKDEHKKTNIDVNDNEQERTRSMDDCEI